MCYIDKKSDTNIFTWNKFDTTKGFTENFSCQIWNIILVIKNRPFLLLKLSNFTRIFGYFQWKRSARGYLVISQKRARFFSVNFMYIGGVYTVLVRDNVQGKFQCPGHVLDIVPDMSRPSVPSKYPIIFRYNKGFKLIYLGQY